MQVAKNNFTDGLVMDLSPDATQNNCLTNALNATYVTMNGNELSLQNDMGNAKFGAKLPEGYIPLGTTQLGGIIYLVIYNPTNGKTQIGSFPSPQFTFGTPKEIANKEIDLAYFENNLQYKQVYTDYILQPGDKFVFEFTEEDKKLIPYLYDESLFTEESATAIESPALKSFLKYSIGTVSQEGKLIQLSNLRNLYVTNSSEENYNVYNSTISGNLALILTKVFCNNVNLQVLVTEADNNTFNLNFTYTFTSNDKFIPSNIYFKINDKETRIKYSNEGSLQKSPARSIVGYFWAGNFNSYSFTYTQSFNKSDFPNNTLYLENVAAYKNLIGANNIQLSQKASKIMDLTKLGTGVVQLTRYTYSIMSKKLIFNFEYTAYLQAGESLNKITANIYATSNDTPLFTKEFSNKSSYYIFNVSYNDTFKANNLYVIDFVFEITRQDTTRNEHITRWVITESGIFNDTILDYDDKVEVTYWKKTVSSELVLKYDSITANYDDIAGLTYNKNVKVTEEHTFNNAELTTKIILDSNIQHIKCSNAVFETTSIEYGTGVINNSTANIDTVKLDDMSISNNQEIQCKLNYTITGNRSVAVTASQNIVRALKDQYSNQYGTVGFAAISISEQQLMDYPFYVEDYLNSKKTNLTIVQLSTNSKLHFPGDNPFDNIWGVYVKGGYEKNILICQKAFKQNEANNIAHALQNLYVYNKYQELTYYTLNESDYTVVKPDIVSITKTFKVSDIDLAIIVNGKVLETAMSDFKLPDNISKPKNMTFDWKEDTSKSTDYIVNMPKAPKDNVSSHLILDYDTMLISNNTIYNLDGTYEENKLYWYDGTIHPFKDSPEFKFKFNNLEFHGDSFDIDEGILQVNNATTLLYSLGSTDKEICKANVNDAVTQTDN